MKKIVLIACALFIGTFFLYSAENLVILGFEHLDQDSRSFLTNLNERNLKAVPTATENFNLIMGKDVEKAMKEAGITSRLMTIHADDAGRVGEALNAAIVIWGTVSKVNNNIFRLSGTMRSQRTGTVQPFSIELSKIDKNQRNQSLKTELFDKLSDFSKGELPTMYEQAILQFMNKQYNSADAQFQRIVAIDSQNTEAYLYLGRIKADQRMFREAAVYYNQGLEIDPDNEDLLRYLSVAYRDQGLIDLSIETLEKIAEARVNRGEPDIAIYYNIATQYKDRGRNDEAMIALDHALEIDPEHEISHKLYSEIAFESGNFEEAIPHLEFILDIRPEDQDSASRLARSYQRTGQLDRAIEKYQTNIKNNPNNISAYLNLASAYITMGQDQNNVNETTRLNRLAIQTYLDAQTIDKNNAGIDSNIAGTYLNLDDLTNAERFANAARQKQVSLIDPHIILGTIAQRRGIMKDNEFIELQKICDSGDLFGKELDDTIAKRDQAKRDAHTLFRNAEIHFNDALTHTDSERTKNDLNQRIRQNSDYIERTKPGLFE